MRISTGMLKRFASLGEATICVDNGIAIATGMSLGIRTFIVGKVSDANDVPDCFMLSLKQLSKLDTNAAEASIAVDGNLCRVVIDKVSFSVPAYTNVIADLNPIRALSDDMVKMDSMTYTNLKSLAMAARSISKIVGDYSGNHIKIKDGQAVSISNSILLQCKVRLPDVSFNSEALLNAFKSLSENDILYSYKSGLLCLSDGTAFYFLDAVETVDFISKDDIMKGSEVVATKVVSHGLPQKLKTYASLGSCPNVIIAYNDKEIDFGMSGGSFSVVPSIAGTRGIINFAMLKALSIFIPSEEILIERGSRHLCLSTQNRACIASVLTY